MTLVIDAIRIAEVEDTLEEAKEQKSFMDDPINNAVNLGKDCISMITKPFKTASTTTPSPK